MTNMQAAVGLAQLERIEQLVAKNEAWESIIENNWQRFRAFVCKSKNPGHVLSTGCMLLNRPSHGIDAETFSAA